MKHIALLRGINVGGKRKILMADLRKLFEELGYLNVSTYIQSGNVVFESPKSEDLDQSANQIKDVIRERYGHEVPVMVLPASELKNAVDQNPFFQAQPDDLKKFHVTFLGTLPKKERMDAISKIDCSPDQFVLSGKHVFIRCEGKYHQSKLTNNFFEKKLGVQATTRNWKTVLKLTEILDLRNE